MNRVICIKGHFYDGDKYSSCPHCAEGAAPIEPDHFAVAHGAEKEEKEEKTVGGLILTTKAASSSYATATVVACGAGKVASTGTLIPMTVKAGDKVLLSKSAGQKIKDNDEELTVVYESEIIAVVE